MNIHSCFFSTHWRNQLILFKMATRRYICGWSCCYMCSKTIRQTFSTSAQATTKKKYSNEVSVLCMTPNLLLNFTQTLIFQPFAGLLFTFFDAWSWFVRFCMQWWPPTDFLVTMELCHAFVTLSRVFSRNRAWILLSFWLLHGHLCNVV